MIRKLAQSYPRTTIGLALFGAFLANNEGHPWLALAIIGGTVAALTFAGNGSDLAPSTSPRPEAR